MASYHFSRIVAFSAPHFSRNRIVFHSLSKLRPSTTMCGTGEEVSYEIDKQEDKKEYLQNATPNGNTTPNRYSELLSACGLDPNVLEHVQKLPNKRRVSPNDVFCNRELKMDGVKAVGFDMDYTLAQYKEPAFDQLAFDGAKAKLVYNMGYPKEVLEFEYDHRYWARGLIIDTQRGNFLKIDRHKYVRVAHHGFDRMSSTTRKLLYSRTFNKVMSFSEKSFVNMGM